MKTDGWPLAPCIWQNFDRWPRFTLTDDKLAVYEKARLKTQINGLKTQMSENGITIVTYLSAAPPEWTRQQLKKIAQSMLKQIKFNEVIE